MASGRHPTWYAFVRWFVRVFYFGTHGGIQGLHEDRVPRTGGLIVAPVHISQLDPPAVACSTRRRLRFMAKEELFDVRVLGPIITSLGSFPVRRGESDTEAIRRAIALLEEGEAVLIFPEGTRNDGETMLPINRGVAMLAKRTNALVVPVGISGTQFVMPRSGRGSKHKVTLSYGEPFRYEDAAQGATERENRELFSAELERRILQLASESGLQLKSDARASGRTESADPERSDEPTPKQSAEVRGQS